MARRGRCRCGTVLEFQRTAHGYKTRCHSCHAVVRLRGDAPAPAPVGDTPAGPAELLFLTEEYHGPIETETQDFRGPLVEPDAPAYQEPKAGGSLAYWLLGGLAALVIVGISATVALWPS